MTHHSATRRGRWIAQFVVRLAFVLVFAGAGLGCVLVGLALIIGPITVYGDPRQPETADRFQGLAAIGMGSITLFALSRCVSDWVAEGDGHGSGTGPVPTVPRDDPPRSTHVETARRDAEFEDASR
jgi:hypothetical protein